MESCDVLNNVGVDSSIVYIENYHGDVPAYKADTQVSIWSSKFAGNNGSALHLSKCTVEFKGNSSFTDNTARNGPSPSIVHTYIRT